MTNRGIWQKNTQGPLCEQEGNSGLVPSSYAMLRASWSPILQLVCAVLLPLASKHTQQISHFEPMLPHWGKSALAGVCCRLESQPYR